MSGLRTRLARLSGARDGEAVAAWWSFVYFFALLAGYYVLRPLRDEMGMQLGAGTLQQLFSAVFVTMLLLIPVFAALLRKVGRRRLLPWLYAFFALNLVGFWAVMSTAAQQSPLVARIFYVWVSVFNLFAVSVFWSFMADLFHTEQAERLYGFIAAGGTSGALAGPVLAMVGMPWFGPRGLMLVSAGCLLVVILAIARLRAWSRNHAAPSVASADQPVSGGLWSGLVDVVRTPYLLGICIFLFAYALLSTFLYFLQTELVPQAIPSGEQRVVLLAQVDLAVNVLTLATQLLAFGTLIRRAGITALLVSMPLVSLLGFAALAIWPVLATLVVFGVLRRAGEYAVSKPARETLYNVLPPDQKYKAKNVIDTLVHRGGDTSSAWIFAGLRQLGLGSSAMAWIAVPIAGIWAATAWWLGHSAAARCVAEPDSSPG